MVRYPYIFNVPILRFWRHFLSVLPSVNNFTPSGSSGEFREAFFSKDSFHGTDRVLRAFIGEAFNDIACGEWVGAVGFDFFSGRGVNAVSGGETFGERFGEIQFPRSEEVAKQAAILGGIMESLGDDAGRETVDKGGAEGFVTTLPVRDGIKKVASFTRGVIQYDDYNVKIKEHKT